jgi:signal transduction histidine kinase/ligand-binding sensor domain-containing protein
LLRIRYYIIALFIINATALWSQITFPKNKFETYDNKNGLSQQNIQGICQDHFGYLWIATEGGLNKFDGYTFKHYFADYSDSTALHDNFLADIYPASNGGIWVGSLNNGLALYNPETDDFTRFRNDPDDINSLGYNVVHAMLEDEKGKLWITLYGGGLDQYIVEKDTFLHYRASEKEGSISSDFCTEFTSDQSGNLWIRTIFGIDKFSIHNRTFQHIPLKGELNDPLFRSFVFIDQKGDLWSTNENGLVRIDTSNFMVEEVKLQRTDLTKRFYKMKWYKDSYYWISNSLGLFLLNIDDYSLISYEPQLTNPYSIAPSVPYHLWKDNFNNLWVGTGNSGISKLNLNETAFLHYYHDPEDNNSLQQDVVRCIKTDSKGNIWVGFSNSGVDCILTSGETIHYFPRENMIGYLPINSPVDILELENGKIWVSTWGDGIYEIDPSKRSVKKLKEFEGQIITEINYDKYGNIWMGKDIGLEIYNPNDKSSFLMEYNPDDSNTISSTSVQSNALLYDSLGNYWVGTWNGLSKIMPDSYNGKLNNAKFNFVRFNYEESNLNSLSNNRIISLTYSDKHPYKIFAGTFGGGLNVITMDSSNVSIHTVKRYSRSHGLPDNSIYGMLPDSEGYIWMSTNNGLSRFNPTSETFTNYYESDGLQNDQFYWGAVAKGTNNTLIFGGINGINVFNPLSLSSDMSRPQVVLNDLIVNYKKVGPGETVNGFEILSKSLNSTQHLTLHHGHKTIGIEFAGIHLSFPEKNKFRYMLEGFDEDWINLTSDRRYISYSNLPPGDYKLKIHAANFNDSWTTIPRILEITVKPPFWLTYWFIISCLVFILIIIVILFQVRSRQIILRNRRLAREVKERTIEIQHQADQLQETNTLLEERQQRIEEQSEELLAQRDELQEVNNVKDKLFSIVAHDLKNPFNVIYGMVDLLHLKYDKYDNEKRKKMVKSVSESTKNMHALLMNLLSWSRAQRGIIEINKVKKNIVEIILNNINQVKDQAFAKEIAIAFIGKETQLITECDADILNTVIRNLITNAIKYCNNGGIIKINCILAGEYYKVSIADNGIGIPKDKQKHILASNSQFSTYGTNNEKGTGLGLQICKDFVEKHGGTLWFESEENKGTTFYFTIPIQ